MMNEVMKSAGGMEKKSQQHSEKARKMGKNVRNMEEKVKRKLEFWAGGRGLEMKEMKSSGIR